DERQLEVEAARAEDADLFFDIAERIAQANYFSWIPLGSRAKFMMLGGGDFIELSELDICSFAIRVVFRGSLVERREFPSRAEALSFANGWLRAHYLADEIAGRVKEIPDDGCRAAEPAELHWGMLYCLTGK